MKIEQSLLDRFIAVRSPELTSEQVSAFFEGITLADVTIDSVQYDGSNNRLYRGHFVCKSKKWRAYRTTWTNTQLVTLLKDSFKFTGTLAEYLEQNPPGKFFVDPGNSQGNLGTLLLPYTDGQTHDEAFLWSMLGAVTGYDFTDMGTVLTTEGKKAHTIERFEPPTVDDSMLFDISLNDRAVVGFRITGPVIEGIVLFTNDGVFNLAQDVDIGTVPGELPAE